MAHYFDDKARKLKAKADEAFLKQKWSKAFSLYEELTTKYHFDVRIMQRFADVARRMKDKPTALRVYKRIAAYYMDEGYWAKALAISKILVGIDPAEKEFLEQLAMRCAGGNTLLDEEDTNPEKELEDTATKIEIEDNSLGEPLEVFEKIPLFSDMSSALVMELVQELERKEIMTGDYICREGDDGNIMYLIADGVVEISSKNAEGNDVVVSELSGGDFFGEFGLLTGNKRSASVQAKNAVELLCINRNDLDKIAAKHPQIWNVLEMYLKNRLIDSIMVKSDVFSSLSSNEREALCENMKERTYKANEVLAQEGEEGDEMFFVKSGWLAVCKNQDGGRISIADLQSGDYFGEFSMLTGKSRSASIVAKTEGVLFSLSRVDASKVFKQNKVLLEKLKRVIQGRHKERKEIISSYLEAKTSLGLV